MPLTDSFLLDPLAPPRVGVWIALRTDGARGSGTEADPYDGSLRSNPVLTVSTITRSGPNGTVATATCASHGFANGDVVVIAGASQAPYNGTFRISNVLTNSFDYLMLSDPGGNATGSLTCTLDPCRFDTVMRTLMFPFPAPPLTIRLGPGTFQTKGWAANFFACWTPRSDWRIVGSGIDVTVLQLIEASIANEHYFAIGNFVYTPEVRLDEFEVSDLTVDCNLAGQPVPAGQTFAPVTCGAIQAGGRHIRIRRVRAINFGCQAAPECFVITSAFARADLTEAVDCVIEDCVVERPSLNDVFMTTCLSMSAGEIASTGVMAYHRACVIRNCVVDCEYKDKPVRISQISIFMGVATVTTVLPHGRNDGDWVRISGAVLAGSTNNSFNGSYSISNVTAYEFKYTPNPAQSTSPTGEIWLGKFPSFPVAISQLTRSGTGPYTVTITTATPHFRVVGGNVVVSLAAPLGYNGSFTVTAVPSPNQLQYQLASDPGSWSAGTGYLGVILQAISNGGGTAAVVEGNRVFNCFISGPYHDTWNTRDLIVRNNHFRAVQEGPYQNMGRNSGEFPYLLKYHNSASQITQIGDGKTALFTTQFDHGFAIGQAVEISFAEVNNNPSNPYNGYFAVESIPASNQFTYRMDTDPGDDADQSPVPQFATLWQVDSLVIENNLIELISSANAYFTPIAIQATRYVGQDPEIGSQRIFKRVVIRGNAIRHVDNVSDPSQIPLAMRLYSSFEAVVEDNIIDLASPIPLQHYQCNRIRYFNNRNSAGKLILGVQIANARQIDPGTVVATAPELSMAIEEAFVLAF